MFTLDTEKSLKTGMRYLAASVGIALAAAVYGLFSHGVYSYFMTYAFMVPLLFGAIPHLAAALKNMPAKKEAGTQAEAAAAESGQGGPSILTPVSLQLALIVTLTVGSLLKGALDIYGTGNRLLVVYPAAAAVIAAALAVQAWKLYRPGCRQLSR